MSFLRLALSLLAAVSARECFACASCGSGGDDPLILYPNEDVKLYLAASRSFGFKTVDVNGRTGTDGGATEKDALTLAVGKALSTNAFVTLTVPYLQNSRGSQNERGWGDPLASLRWTVLPQDITEEWRPQVQVLLGHRFAVARSIHESNSLHALDVFGSGTPETKSGLDVFWGMTNVKFGFAHVYYLPGAREFAGVTVEPGLGQKQVVTLGYGVSPYGKVLVGLTREIRSERRENGRRVPESSERNHGGFLTIDYNISSLSVLRATFATRGSFFTNRNTSSSNSASVAYMRAL